MYIPHTKVVQGGGTRPYGSKKILLGYGGEYSTPLAALGSQHLTAKEHLREPASDRLGGQVRAQVREEQ